MNAAPSSTHPERARLGTAGGHDPMAGPNTGPDYRRLDACTYLRLRRLLNTSKPFSAPGLGQRLDTIASTYRWRLLDPPRSRRDDRASLLALAEVAELVAAELDRFDDGVTDQLRGVPPVPVVNERQAWLNDLASRLRLLDLTNLEADLAEGDRERLTDLLKALVAGMAGLDRTARIHPLFTLKAGWRAWPAETWSDRLSDAVRVFAGACRWARACWKALKGPEPRSPIMLLAEDLYCVVREARGRPLVLRLHDRDRQYVGQPANDDSRFLLAFTDHVHGTVPKVVRRDHPQRFVARAIFDAYKELTEEVSKGYDPCVARDRSSRVR